MLKIAIKKEELGHQLWPFSINNTLIFSNHFANLNGWFGVRNNNLRFIPEKDIPEEFEIEIPEDNEETQGFLGSAEYLVHRIMLTPKIVVIGLPQDETLPTDLKAEVLKAFLKFIENYNNNSKLLEGLKNGCYQQVLDK
jgi:hypothetical protein